ncbi:LptA/OstA family protein [Phenylobacterium sp. J367]|uniref:LptA/OstA family protein n=1 Tax=Phenylobacterium sp. J367 TaxID=2898435 RepID=UPI0021517E28|nr:LptA/OstA family protein [Phenylobacterium sp. J367]MCR5878331.1 organic solvent tolerance protein OstA [Phenylobacterium sp. J367]
MPTKHLIPIVATAVALVAGSAAAQLAKNSDAPVDITADELEVTNNACTAIWKGNAEALQETSRLRAQVLKIFNKPAAGGGGQTGGCGELDRLEAEGQVYYMTPDQRVRANQGIYTAANSTLTMTGDVVAVQGQNVIRGTKMVFNTKTGEGNMVGQATGKNAQGRVRGVFYPSKSNAQAKN